MSLRAKEIPIVGLEPSCTAVLRRRGVAARHRGGAAGGRRDRDARRAADPRPGLHAAGPDRCRGRRPATLPPPRGDVLGGRPAAPRAGRGDGDPDRWMLRSRRQLRRREGCYEVSVAVAETQLLPAVRAAAPDRRRPWPTASLPPTSSTTWPREVACTSRNCSPRVSGSAARRPGGSVGQGRTRPTGQAVRRGCRTR